MEETNINIPHDELNMRWAKIVPDVTAEFDDGLFELQTRAKVRYF